LHYPAYAYEVSAGASIDITLAAFIAGRFVLMNLVNSPNINPKKTATDIGKLNRPKFSAAKSTAAIAVTAPIRHKNELNLFLRTFLDSGDNDNDGSFIKLLINY
jgi:hypothetical protein